MDSKCFFGGLVTFHGDRLIIAIGLVPSTRGMPAPNRRSRNRNRMLCISCILIGSRHCNHSVCLAVPRLERCGKNVLWQRLRLHCAIRTPVFWIIFFPIRLSNSYDVNSCLYDRMPCGVNESAEVLCSNDKKLISNPSSGAALD